MNNPLPLPDAEARRFAETTFDRNVVVLAGAGTGKTTLLVNRLIHALLREPDSFRLTEIVALTFTNRAANEMKSRLRDRLHELLADCEGQDQPKNSGGDRLGEFRECYRLSTDHIKERVQVALGDMEKAQIGTLHSFAAHVLRLYPLESGVDPHFQEDDGTQFSEMFQEIWDGWLEQELGPQGSAHTEWREILQEVGLKEIRNFAFSLCGDSVSLQELKAQVDSAAPTPACDSWVHTKQQQIVNLLKRHAQPHPRKIEKMLGSAAHVYDAVARKGWSGVAELVDSEKALLGSPIGKAPKSWEEIDFQEARRAIQSANRLLQVNEICLRKVIHLLEPLTKRIRQAFSDKGWMRFDGLLILVRDLLRDHPTVREELKANFRAILVDEFQDTDPLQYEILLYLGERPGDRTRLWRDIRLVPGKLFVVGDPKQSIYGFRLADIEAFDQVVHKLTDEGGMVCTLTTNFRSAQAILEVVNVAFDQLFIPQVNVQPPNVPLAAGRTREEGCLTPEVEISVVANLEDSQEWDAEQAARMEAEWLANWIQDQLCPGAQWVLENGVRKPLCPGHIAVLFRKFTNAQVYLEAMHRQGVPYLTDGERHFYRRQEVIDMVNVLRVLDDPTDAIALMGILRSSLGGVPDHEIMALARLGPLDIRRTERLKEWESTRSAVIETLFSRLATLHVQAKRIPLHEFIDQLFAQLPIVELAAASSHGEQAVVNIWKLRDLMSVQAAVPHLSFSRWVDRLVDFLRTHPTEPEAPLAEDTLEAVRVMTIHKAKGLEFPVVVLPGLHQKAAGPVGGAAVTFDWISGLYGCTLPPMWNANQIPLWEKHRIREEAEQRRVLYVAMTRARDRLVLSGGRLKNPNGGSHLGLLQNIVEGELGNPKHDTVYIGSIAIRQNVITPRTLKSQKALKSARERTEIGEHSETMPSLLMRDERDVIWQQGRHVSAFVTPSSLHQPKVGSAEGKGRVISGETSQRLGILVHQLLERWDFQSAPEKLQEHLAGFFREHLVGEPVERKGELLGEIEVLMDMFLHSSIYRELQRATVLGREVPFSLPWPMKGEKTCFPEMRVMEGVMDVVYEIDGEVWVGDYKTDQVSSSTVEQRAERYRNQAYLYVVAASRCLGLEVKGCKLFFIRIGESVTVQYVPGNVPNASYEEYT